MIQRGKYNQVVISKTSEITKHYLRDVIKRLVKHQQFIHDHIAVQRRAGNQAALDKIKLTLEYFRDKDLRCHCQMVVNIEAELTAVLPGEKSRFYPNVNNQVADLISFSKKLLNK